MVTAKVIRRAEEGGERKSEALVSQSHAAKAPAAALSTSFRRKEEGPQAPAPAMLTLSVETDRLSGFGIRHIGSSKKTLFTCSDTPTKTEISR